MFRRDVHFLSVTGIATKLSHKESSVDSGAPKSHSEHDVVSYIQGFGIDAETTKNFLDCSDMRERGRINIIDCEEGILVQRYEAQHTGQKTPTGPFCSLITAESLSELGIGEWMSDKHGFLQERKRRVFYARGPVKLIAMKSRQASDNWSVPGIVQQTKGGALQFLILEGMENLHSITDAPLLESILDPANNYSFDRKTMLRIITNMVIIQQRFPHSAAALNEGATVKLSLSLAQINKLTMNEMIDILLLIKNADHLTFLKQLDIRFPDARLQNSAWREEKTKQWFNNVEQKMGSNPKLRKKLQDNLILAADLAMIAEEIFLASRVDSTRMFQEALLDEIYKDMLTDFSFSYVDRRGYLYALSGKYKDAILVVLDGLRIHSSLNQSTETSTNMNWYVADVGAAEKAVSALKDYLRVEKEPKIDRIYKIIFAQHAENPLSAGQVICLSMQMFSCIYYLVDGIDPNTVRRSARLPRMVGERVSVPEPPLVPTLKADVNVTSRYEAEKLAKKLNEILIAALPPGFGLDICHVPELDAVPAVRDLPCWYNERFRYHDLLFTIASQIRQVTTTSALVNLSFSAIYANFMRHADEWMIRRKQLPADLEIKVKETLAQRAINVDAALLSRLFVVLRNYVETEITHFRETLQPQIEAAIEAARQESLVEQAELQRQADIAKTNAPKVVEKPEPTPFEKLANDVQSNFHSEIRDCRKTLQSLSILTPDIEQETARYLEKSDRSYDLQYFNKLLAAMKECQLLGVDAAQVSNLRAVFACRLRLELLVQGLRRLHDMCEQSPNALPGNAKAYFDAVITLEPEVLNRHMALLGKMTLMKNTCRHYIDVSREFERRRATGMFTFIPTGEQPPSLCDESLLKPFNDKPNFPLWLLQEYPNADLASGLMASDTSTKSDGKLISALWANPDCMKMLLTLLFESNQPLAAVIDALWRGKSPNGLTFDEYKKKMLMDMKKADVSAWFAALVQEVTPLRPAAQV